jgi:hypothetical protein
MIITSKHEELEKKPVLHIQHELTPPWYFWDAYENNQTMLFFFHENNQINRKLSATPFVLM